MYNSSSCCCCCSIYVCVFFATLPRVLFLYLLFVAVFAFIFHVFMFFMSEVYFLSYLAAKLIVGLVFIPNAFLVRKSMLSFVIACDCICWRRCSVVMIDVFVHCCFVCF